MIDYGDIKSYLNPILEEFLDHHYLNESLDLENPTCEAIAKWLFETLEKTTITGLYAVEIQETCTSGARYCKV